MPKKSLTKPTQSFTSQVIWESVGCFFDGILSFIFFSTAYILYNRYHSLQNNFSNTLDLYYVFYWIHVCIIYDYLNLFGQTKANSTPYLRENAKIYKKKKRSKNYSKITHFTKVIIYIVAQTMNIYFGFIFFIKFIQLLKYYSINNKQFYQNIISFLIGKSPKYNEIKIDLFEMIRYILLSLFMLKSDRMISQFLKKYKLKIKNYKYNYIGFDGSWMHITYRCLFIRYSLKYNLMGKMGVVFNANYKLMSCIYWNRWNNMDYITILIPFIFIYFDEIYKKSNKVKTS